MLHSAPKKQKFYDPELEEEKARLRAWRFPVPTGASNIRKMIQNSKGVQTTTSVPNPRSRRDGRKEGTVHLEGCECHCSELMGGPGMPELPETWKDSGDLGDSKDEETKETKEEEKHQSIIYDFELQIQEMEKLHAEELKLTMLATLTACAAMYMFIFFE